MNEPEGRTATMFSFTITIEGADVMADDAQVALFEAGCDETGSTAVSTSARGRSGGPEEKP